MDTISVIKCGFVNIQSVVNKTLQIRDIINEETLDVLAIAETWLNEFDSAIIREMTPSTHLFLHVPREGRRGGGVGIFVPRSCSHLRIINRTQFASFEHIETRFKYANQNFSFIVVYRPPQLNIGIFLEDFAKFLDTLDMIAMKVYICGDFNIWMDAVEHRDTVSFCELLEAHRFLNNVQTVTTVSGHILDLVLSDVENGVLDLVVEGECTVSPFHRFITFKILARNQKVTKRITFRNKSNFLPAEFIDNVIGLIETEVVAFCEHGENSLLKSDCVECFMEVYNRVIKTEYNSICPLVEKTIKIVDKSPWFNSEILSLKRERRRMEHRWLRLKTEEARNEYVIARNRYNNSIKKRKRQYYHMKIKEAGTDMNKLYGVLDNLTGRAVEKKLPDGYANQELAEKFLRFFKEKIDNIVSVFNETLSMANNEPEFEERLTCFKSVNIDDVVRIIRKTKKTYCILDPIHISEIIEVNNFPRFADMIMKIINLSILSIKVPTSERVAIVKPILKGRLDSQDVSSYRPVSNLSFVSKILENVILEQLNIHLQKIDVMPDCQSAYRQLYSTETTICSVVNDLLEMMDEGSCGVLVLLDLSAAFDTVVHELLLDDLKLIGIVDDALEYLRSYLSDRKYCVQIGNSFSSYETLERGVPQGSILGPILFCIYTIGLSRVLQGHGVKFKLFADDTQFYFAINNIVNTRAKLTNILTCVKEWMTLKQLKLNENKTEFMLVGGKLGLRNLGDFQLVVNNSQVMISDKVRDLGVQLDCNLSLVGQINNVVRVTGHHLRNIAFVKKYLDESSLRKLVISCVVNRVDYCNSIYYNLPKKQLKKLQSILNRAARLVKGAAPMDRITPVLMELHWLPIKARVIFKLCVLAHQAIKTGRPKYLRDLLSIVQLTDGVNTRTATDGLKLYEPRCISSIGFRAFKYAAPRLYNKLPFEIRKIENMKTFKRKLKTFLFSVCYDASDRTINTEYAV